MRPPGPVLLGHLFGPLHERLLGILRGLSRADWERPTRAGSWTVRDVAAHLLDGDLRKLSVHRDGHRLPVPSQDLSAWSGLVAYLNELNAQWVDAARRISPTLLVEMLALTGPEVANFVSELDPFGPALWPVAWAGEAQSLNWMDTGREFTERWHHQQQIREATGAGLLLDARWLRPVLDISVRALPRAYADVTAAEGAGVVFRVDGPAGGEWSLVRERDGWRLYEGAFEGASAVASTDGDTAWRMFFKGLAADEARRRVRLEGEPRLGEPLLSALAVMA
jgi:uncharacterized protein (TIGR03083 family)